jgi:hypothetical protein
MVAEAGNAMTSFAPEVALDALFRRNASARHEMPALHDLDGVALSYAELAKAVGNVAEQISSLGLPPRSNIALLLPNGRELVAALLGVMRSGHTAVPMPVAWRKADLVRACREAEAAALITTANFHAERLPDLAAEVAIEVFELSFPCSFGSPLPDGIVPFSLFADGDLSLSNAAISQSSSAGIATLQQTGAGMSFVLHRDEELLAAGLGAMLACEVQSGDRIVSALSLTTFAGLSSAFVPWLLSGGVLTLLADVPERDAIAFDKNTHLVAPVGALQPLSAIMPSAIASASAVHFAGVNARTAFPALNARTLVDITAFGEFCTISLPRRERTMPAPLILGEIHAGDTGAASPVIVETSLDNGRILVRGAMVPKDTLGDQPWLDTRFTVNAGDVGPLYPVAPAEQITIGALRFDLPDLERRIRAAALVADVRVISDKVLGNRLVISSERPEETTRALLEAGLPRIVAAAVQKADSVRAKAG